MNKVLQSMKIAFRALRVNKLRSALTMLGVIIGVGAVIAMVAVGSGATKRIQEQIASIGSNVIIIQAGSVNTGAFTNDEALLGRVMAAAKDEGEKMWHMPLDDDYKELLKSAFADVANIGGRWGGAISAAWFLKEWADDTPWVHLDIAGTAWLDDAKPFMAKGPTGVCVRTFAKLALGW